MALKEIEAKLEDLDGKFLFLYEIMEKKDLLPKEGVKDVQIEAEK